MTSSEPDNKPVSEQLTALMPSPEDHKATMMALEDIADDLGLPKFGDFIDEDISPEMIQGAVEEQVKAVENRLATMNKSRLKKPGPRIQLPLWYHLPQGKQVIKRLMLCARFTVPEIAQMLGLRYKQLQEFIAGMGLSGEQKRLEISAKMRKYKELTAELCTYGRMRSTQAAVKMIEDATDDPDSPVLKLRPKDLAELNKILVANDPTEKEATGALSGHAPAINIGVKVTSVDRSHKVHQLADEDPEDNPYP